MLCEEYMHQRYCPLAGSIVTTSQLWEKASKLENLFCFNASL